MTQSNEEKNPLSSLSLCIARGASPFALISLRDCTPTPADTAPDYEIEFRDDNLSYEEWAWQFLRLNTGYREAYVKASKLQDENPEISSQSRRQHASHPERKVLVNEKYCQRLGLSTWLNPDTPRLPRLKRGESWFFPLKQVAYSPESKIEGLAAHGIWRYQDVCRNPEPQKAHPSMSVSTGVWFAVDCSVLPEAQLDSIEIVSRSYRGWLRRMDRLRAPSQSAAKSVVPLSECNWFDEPDSFSPCFAASGVRNKGDLWRALCIDVCGPIKAQIDQCRPELHREYTSMCKEKLAKPPIKDRIRGELIVHHHGKIGAKKVKNLNDGTLPSDGFLLKALVIVAQFSQQGYGDSEIANLLIHEPDVLPSELRSQGDGMVAPSGNREAGLEKDKRTGQQISRLRPGPLGDGAGNAFDNFEIRIHKYKERAREFVKGGYRWLIHAQKP